MQEGQRATTQAAAAILPDKDAKRKSEEKFQALNLFLARGTSDGNLNLSEYAAWTCMWAAERNGFVSISYRQVARECNMDLKTAKRAIGALQKKNMAKKVKQGNIRGDVNRYVLSPYPNEGKLTEKAAAHGQIAPTPGGVMPLPLGANPSKPGGKNGPHPDRKEEVVTSSSFQTGRSGPTDARLGDARSVLPTPRQTNSDGGTNPLCPPSASTHEASRPDDAKDDDFRKEANKWIDERLALGEPLETIRTGSRYTIAKGDFHKQRIFDEELAKRRMG